MLELFAARLELFALLVGVGTVYGNRVDAVSYDGRPLYCYTNRNPYTYSVATVPWVAVDVSEYLTGRIHCGDDLMLYFPDGQMRQAKALDAGYLYRFYVADYPGQSIVVDVPEHLAPFDGVTLVKAINLSAVDRWIWRKRLNRMEETTCDQNVYHPLPH